MPPITPNLWFDTEAEQAAEFYVSVFPNSSITEVQRNGDAAMMVHFTLDGRVFAGLNGGPQFPFTEAVSFRIDCADQAEADRYWDALVEGGTPSQCGWLKDRFGVSWQVVPAGLGELLGDPDPGRAQRAMQAMFGMTRLDLAAMRAAADAA